LNHKYTDEIDSIITEYPKKVPFFNEILKNNFVEK